MHRSGTSLVTSLLRAFGFDFGGPRLDPQPDNPRGFWEHKAIVRIHDDFLQCLGRTWSDPRPFRSGEFEGRTADRARAQLHEVLVKDFLSQPLWVLKDPRICRLGPLWDPLFANENVAPRYLTVVRSPIAVARSLAQREGFSTHKSLLLWLRHYLEAETWTRGQRRSWALLDSVRQDPRGAIEHGLRLLKVDHRLLADPENGAINDIYDPELIHHDTEADREDESGTATPWVDSMWEALRVLAGDMNDGEALRMIDAIRTSIGVADDLMMSDPVVWEVDSLRDRAEGVRTALLETRNLVGEVFRGGGGYAEMLEDLRSTVVSTAKSVRSVQTTQQVAEDILTGGMAALDTLQADAVPAAERATENTAEIGKLTPSQEQVATKIRGMLDRLNREIVESRAAIVAEIGRASLTLGGDSERLDEALRRLELSLCQTEARLGARMKGLEESAVSRDRFLEDYSAAVRTVDELREERESLTFGREQAVLEIEALRVERDGLSSGNRVLIDERNRLLEEKNAMAARKDYLARIVDESKIEIDRLKKRGMPWQSGTII